MSRAELEINGDVPSCVLFVFQDPSSTQAPISASPYSALQALDGFMQLHSADRLEEAARPVGLVREDLTRVESAGGKRR